jgi:hypothetical protein
MDERTIGSERREALGKATKLLDLAISRQAEGTRDPEWMIEQARHFIDAGAYMIMIESESITENADPWRTDVPAEVAVSNPAARHMVDQEPLGPCPHLQGIASWRFE